MHMRHKVISEAKKHTEYCSVVLVIKDTVIKNPGV